MGGGILGRSRNLANEYQQMPLFQCVSDLEVRYLAYGELDRHREAIARFGEGMKAINSIAKSLR